MSFLRARWAAVLMMMLPVFGLISPTILRSRSRSFSGSLRLTPDLWLCGM